MLDLLLEPVKMFIENGIEGFTKSKEFRNLQISYLERLVRELQYNRSLIYKIEKINKDEKKTEEIKSHSTIELVKLFKTRTFDDLENYPIPLFVMLKKKSDNQKENTLHPEKWRNIKHLMDKYPKVNFYIDKLLETNTDSLEKLLERTYYRLQITQALVNCKGEDLRFDYLAFLLDQTKYELQKVLNVSKPNEGTPPSNNQGMLGAFSNFAKKMGNG